MQRRVPLFWFDHAHEWLARHSDLYGRWHEAPVASAVHWLALAGYLVLVATLGSAAVAPALSASAETNAIDFEAGYVAGNIDGQQGWTNTGGLDAAVVPNTYGYAPFGATSLRISNGITSSGFGNQPFAPYLDEEAGETTAYSTAPTPTRWSSFFAQFDVASTVPGAEQSGLAVRVSPDAGGGIRMAWLEIVDTPSGLAINTQDFHDLPPYGSTGSPSDGCGVGGDTFTGASVASGLDRSVPHTVRIAMTLIDGPANDVVSIYVDGALAFTGTDWEDYHRWCEGAPNESRTIRTLLFRMSGAAAPAALGNGLLFDNFIIASGALPKAITAFSINGSAGTIDQSTHTVAVTVPYGTDATSLAPTVAIAGASVSPASGSAQDFTLPRTYTVTAADLTTQDYLVTVTAAAAPPTDDAATEEPIPDTVGGAAATRTGTTTLPAATPKPLPGAGSAETGPASSDMTLGITDASATVPVTVAGSTSVFQATWLFLLLFFLLLLCLVQFWRTLDDDGLIAVRQTTRRE